MTICHERLVDGAGRLARPGPITFRPASGTGGRAAVEVLAGTEVVGVHVDTVFCSALLGALRARRGGPPWALAWGGLPPDGGRPTVTFLGRRPGRVPRVVTDVEVVAGRFWVAWAPGRFREVKVAVAGRPVIGAHRRLARMAGGSS
jgi:hypothetical protein